MAADNPSQDLSTQGSQFLNWSPPTFNKTVVINPCILYFIQYSLILFLFVFLLLWWRTGLRPSPPLEERYLQLSEHLVVLYLFQQFTKVKMSYRTQGTLRINCSKQLKLCCFTCKEIDFHQISHLNTKSIDLNTLPAWTKWRFGDLQLVTTQQGSKIILQHH